MALLLLAGYPRRVAVLAAAWLAASMFASAKAWAQNPVPAASGLQIQPLGSGIPSGITLDGPRSKGPAAPIYIDGKLSSNSALVALNPDDVADIKIFKGSDLLTLAPGATDLGALFITTRQHAVDSTVVSFNRRVAELEKSKELASPPSDDFIPTTLPKPKVRIRLSDIMPRPRMYVDGQPADSAMVAAVNPIDIASVYVLKGAAAAALSPQAAGRGVVSIVSKRNAQKRRVRKFEQHLRQLEAANPLTPATIERDNAVQSADVRYYLNGQPSTWAAVRDVYPSIKGAQALRGKQAAAYAHDPAITEVFLVETNP